MTNEPGRLQITHCKLFIENLEVTRRDGARRSDRAVQGPNARATGKVPLHEPPGTPQGLGLRQSSAAIEGVGCPTAAEDCRTPRRCRDHRSANRFTVPMHGRRERRLPMNWSAGTLAGRWRAEKRAGKGA